MRFVVKAVAVVSVVILSAGLVFAGPKDPVTGKRFIQLRDAQNTPLQSHLEAIFPESGGYFITGPLDIFFTGPSDAEQLYHSTRIICPTLEAFENCLFRLQQDTIITIENSTMYLHQSRMDFPVGYRGALANIHFKGRKHTIQFNTIQQTRWLIWVKGILAGKDNTIAVMPLEAYSREVSDHLYGTDRRWDDLPTKNAIDFGLFDTLDIYREAPEYTISGYKNYKDFLKRHRAAYTKFAKGLVAFIPSDSLLRQMKKKAPRKAYPNKEYRMLQMEYLKFLVRGGDVSSLNTLTKDIFDTLQSGEYFFAVGVSGKVRFGRELMREEVAEIELKTGKKVPRANHAFLFPGEPLLTAGAFFIERDSVSFLTEVTAGSGHYFYSNLTKSIRTDIAELSNQYVLTLGHFFNALDRLSIEYNDVLVRKY